MRVFHKPAIRLLQQLTPQLDTSYIQWVVFTLLQILMYMQLAPLSEQTLFGRLWDVRVAILYVLHPEKRPKSVSLI